MNKYIVITSIFSPSLAVEKFSVLDGYKLVVVGDKKSPTGWEQENVRYLSIEHQELMDFTLAGELPYNHYCRKMMGYLYAIREGADFIVDTDDDNIPYEEWGFPEMEGVYDHIDADLGFINIYQLYTSKKIWPRGLPLKLINTNFELYNKILPAHSRIGVWQGLADEDPDVDAIYRLTSDESCFFEKRNPIVLKNNTICSFNSQNTIFRKELFALLYLPTYVTFRFTDILRGLVAQPIMWLFNYHLGFTSATVIQKRNPHDYMKDFVSEVPMYFHAENIIKIVLSVISADRSISDNLLFAYNELHINGIVEHEELNVLRAWIKDINNITNS
jgi:hypothetical protein